MNDESSDHELTTNVEPAPDGSKLEGHTPGGTRVGTPSSAPRPGLPSGRARGSYAAALKTPSSTSDWHLKFYMGEQELSLDSTVYGAVHHFESQQNNAAGSRTMWSNVYTVRFKKVPGPPSVPCKLAEACHRVSTKLIALSSPPNFSRAN